MCATPDACPVPSDGSSTDVGTARFVVFDWDGTAVADRAPDSARHLIGPLEELIDHGVRPYIVTGTKHDWIVAQLGGLRLDFRPRVTICCNRGSEVYRLDPDGAALLHRRTITHEEQQSLTRIGTSVTRPLTEAGHDVPIITDRLNRIKIDLLPDWTDPPKHQIETVVDLANVTYRDFGGLNGLLRTTLKLVASAAPDLRVTSDAKHIEIGVTDKSHSMAWILVDVAKHGGTVADMLIVGDEFGPLGGIEGSDAKTAIPGAIVYSVGREPNGVPSGITHVGGGPQQLVRILDSVIASGSRDERRSDMTPASPHPASGSAHGREPPDLTSTENVSR